GLLNIPAGRPITIAISGQSDTTSWERVEQINLASGGRYLWTLQGTIDTTDAWPVQSEIRAYPVAPIDANGPAVSALNGLLWQEAVDLIIDTPFEQMIADSSSSGTLSNWIQPNAGAQYVRVKNHTNGEERCAYLWDMTSEPIVQPLFIGQENPLDSLSTVHLFRIPLAGGAFEEFPSIPPPPVFTQAQFVHTSSDVALAVVDVYANDVLIIDNFNLHQASPALQVLAEEAWNLSVAPGNSTSAADALFTQSITLPASGQHLIALAGIYSTAGYNPAPDPVWKVFENMRTEAQVAGQTDILFFASATDLGTFDLLDAGNTAVNWFDQATFGSFSEYQSFDGNLDEGILATNAAGSFMYGAWALPIVSSAWANQSVLIYSSGFFNPSNNFNGGPLTFWYASSNGLSGQLPLYVGVQETALTTFITLYPNPTAGVVHLKANLARPIKHFVTVMDMNGRVVYRDQVQGGGMISKTWDFGNLEAGVYVVRLECNQQVESYRFNLVQE
ncbi:MAG: T9SS type A sorting domain-containing protein, partial [Flavobacteriales bacterium]